MLGEMFRLQQCGRRIKGRDMPDILGILQATDELQWDDRYV
jgi:hypothetical protein